MRRNKSLLASVLISTLVGVSSAGAATPTPHPASKATAKASAKASTKPVTRVSAQPSAKSGAKASAKKTVKSSTTHKAVVHHYYYRPRPRIGVAPSPSPKWPPAGFVNAGSVYARIPSGDELVGILSASQDPSGSVNQCAPDPSNPSAQAVACGAILAASANGCSWWEVNSTLVGPDPSNAANIIPLGGLRTLAAGTAAHSISTIILVSGVPLENGMKFTSITAKCWMTQTDETVPSDVFTPLPGIQITPAPSTPVSPTPTPTPSASS